MWLVACRRQGILCKLNISSSLTLQHLFDCLICTRNSMPIVLLNDGGGGGDGIGGDWGVVDL